MVTLTCSVEDCRCSLEHAASVELLVHTDDLGQGAVCLHHQDAAPEAVAPFYCQVPSQRTAGEGS